MEKTRCLEINYHTREADFDLEDAISMLTNIYDFFYVEHKPIILLYDLETKEAAQYMNDIKISFGRDVSCKIIFKTSQWIEGVIQGRITSKWKCE
jgi:hypothetical protein